MRSLRSRIVWLCCVLTVTLTLDAKSVSTGSVSAGAPESVQSSPAESSVAPMKKAKMPIVTKRPSVVARYPHNSQAFVQGLQYVGDGQYLRSTGLVGASGVQLVELASGKTKREVPMPISGGFGEGLTMLNGTVYQLTWKKGQALTFGFQDFREQGRYRYKGEGWGLTHDGNALINSDGSSTLAWRDPKTFAVLRKMTIKAGNKTVTHLNELEYVRGVLFANIWLTDTIARIDPKTGRVLSWLDISELSQEAHRVARKKGKPLTFNDVANGIAYVPERDTLLLTGKNWPIMFEVRR